MIKKELRKRFISYLGLLGCLISTVLLSGGCATPIGVKLVKQETVYQSIDKSALNSDSISSYTAVVLHRYGIQDDQLKKNPLKVIENLHRIACNDDRRDVLLSLSELCFLYGQKGKILKRDDKPADNESNVGPLEGSTVSNPTKIKPRMFYSSSVIYAYLFMLGPGREPPPGRFDRRFRLACDLYNRSLAFTVNLKKQEGKPEAKSGEQILHLPFGKIRLFHKVAKLPWSRDELAEVISADRLKIYGLSVRNRIPGLGAPIVVVRKKSPDMPISSAIPMTMFIQIYGGIKDFETGDLSGEISFFPSRTEDEIIIDDKAIPLEKDLTAPLAYTLNDSLLWNMGRRLFRMGKSQFKTGIYPLQPYQPGCVPVVLVHGTMSSPVWWSEMLNTLNSDRRLMKSCQIWLYLYDSGKPLAFSAVEFRELLARQIKNFDPQGQDPAMQNVAIIGHSQGGLLTRFASVDTGESLIKAVTNKSLDELDISPEEKELLTRYGVFSPMPEVSRVIFISTPHRGSVLAGSFAKQMARRFINLPGDVMKTGAEFLTIAEKINIPDQLKKGMAKTSIDSMSPDNPSLLTVANLPIPPGVKAHSIIAIDGDEEPPEGSDGVVTYKSAHLDGVESEMVVRSGHSSQQHPLVIEEVRRILLEHLQIGIAQESKPNAGKTEPLSNDE